MIYLIASGGSGDMLYAMQFVLKISESFCYYLGPPFGMINTSI